MKPTLESLIAGIPSLGSTSDILGKVQAVLLDQRSNLAHVGQIIEKDPDLTARLLRLGNSAYFGFQSRVETVSETIALIGVQHVQDLLAATAVVDLFDGISPKLVNMASFWKHSLACGLAARALATTRQVTKPEKFFVAGLLHDVGRLVILEKAAEQAVHIFKVSQQDKILLRDAELRILGFDHTEVGEALLKAWNFPHHLADSVRYHHCPIIAEANQLEACIVHIADVLVHALDIGSSGERLIPLVQTKAWERLELPLTSLASVVEVLDQQLVEVEKAFLPSRPVIV